MRELRCVEFEDAAEMNSRQLHGRLEAVHILHHGLDGGDPTWNGRLQLNRKLIAIVDAKVAVRRP